MGYTYLSNIRSNNCNLGENVQAIVDPTGKKYAASLGQIESRDGP